MTFPRSQQFPPLGSKNRKQSQLNHQVAPPRQQQQLSQQQQNPQQQQQQPSHQQQSSPQQLGRSSQQLINDQQWQRQEQMFMQSNQKLSVHVAQMDKLFQIMVSMMGLVSKLLPQNSPGTAFAEFLPINVAQP